MPLNPAFIWTMQFYQHLVSKAKLDPMTMWEDMQMMGLSSYQRSEEEAKLASIISAAGVDTITSQVLISRTMLWSQSWCQGRRAMRGWWSLTINQARVHPLSNRETKILSTEKPPPRRIKKFSSQQITAPTYREPNWPLRARRHSSTMTRPHPISHASKRAKAWLLSKTTPTTQLQAISKWLARISFQSKKPSIAESEKRKTNQLPKFLDFSQKIKNKNHTHFPQKLQINTMLYLTLFIAFYIYKTLSFLTFLLYKSACLLLT